MELKSVEDTSWLQLFIKNTALCKHESGRIRCDAYTSSCDLAEPYVFSKQSLPPILCHLYLVAQIEVTLIPKLRVHFAEFLQHRSLKRLGILYLSTCVGFGYGLIAGVISWDTFTAHSIQ